MFIVCQLKESARSLRRAAAMFAMSLVLVGAMATSAKSAETTVRISEDFGTLDPAFWQSGADLTMINVLFPKLIEFKSDKNWEWELQAAESIEQVDELTIKFTLKPGLMWTDGYGEVTTEDVKYSYERYLDPELDSPIIGDWAPLKEVEIVDKYSGIIHLKEPFAPIWWSTLPYSSGAIVSKRRPKRRAVNSPPTPVRQLALTRSRPGCRVRRSFWFPMTVGTVVPRDLTELHFCLSRNPNQQNSASKPRKSTSPKSPLAPCLRSKIHCPQAVFWKFAPLRIIPSLA